MNRLSQMWLLHIAVDNYLPQYLFPEGWVELRRISVYQITTPKNTSQYWLYTIIGWQVAQWVDQLSIDLRVCKANILNQAEIIEHFLLKRWTSLLYFGYEYLSSTGSAVQWIWATGDSYCMLQHTSLVIRENATGKHVQYGLTVQMWETFYFVCGSCSAELHITAWWLSVICLKASLCQDE